MLFIGGFSSRISGEDIGCHEFTRPAFMQCRRHHYLVNFSSQCQVLFNIVDQGKPLIRLGFRTSPDFQNNGNQGTFCSRYRTDISESDATSRILGLSRLILSQLVPFEVAQGLLGDQELDLRLTGDMHLVMPIRKYEEYGLTHVVLCALRRSIQSSDFSTHHGNRNIALTSQ